MNAFIAVRPGLRQRHRPGCLHRCPGLEVRKIRVANELGCATGWQEIIARTDLREDIGKTAYLKTECRRVKERD